MYQIGAGLEILTLRTFKHQGKKKPKHLSALKTLSPTSTHSLVTKDQLPILVCAISCRNYFPSTELKRLHLLTDEWQDVNIRRLFRGRVFSEILVSMSSYSVFLLSIDVYPQLKKRMLDNLVPFFKFLLFFFSFYRSFQEHRLRTLK